MGEALHRIWRETTAYLPRFGVWGRSVSRGWRRRARAEDCQVIGEHGADYIEISPEQWRQPDPDVEALFKRSKIVSAKHGL
jgi:hypothetical protein